AYGRDVRLIDSTRRYPDRASPQVQSALDCGDAKGDKRYSPGFVPRTTRRQDEYQGNRRQSRQERDVSGCHMASRQVTAQRGPELRSILTHGRTLSQEVTSYRS